MCKIVVLYCMFVVGLFVFVRGTNIEIPLVGYFITEFFFIIVTKSGRLIHSLVVPLQYKSIASSRISTHDSAPWNLQFIVGSPKTTTHRCVHMSMQRIDSLPIGQIDAFHNATRWIREKEKGFVPLSSHAGLGDHISPGRNSLYGHVNRIIRIPAEQFDRICLGTRANNRVSIRSELNRLNGCFRNRSRAVFWRVSHDAQHVV